MLRVLLAEDHLIVRQSIKLFLESKGVAVIGESNNGREAIEMARALHPDVLILDIHMPELTGIEVARRIRHEDENIRILVLTAYNEPSYVYALLDAGADGYVLKTAELSELYQALQEVAVGGKAFDSDLIRKAKLYHQSQADMAGALTERELKVLYQAAKGLTNKEIGRVLFVSDRTVQGHLQNIYEKFGVATRTEAVTKALSLQLITLDQDEAS